MKRLSTIAIAATLAACSGQSSGPVAQPGSGGANSPAGAATTLPPASASAPRTLDVDENLGRLRALEIFEVIGVIENIPEQANCYNLACPGHEKEFADAKAAAEQKLASFTEAAVEASALPPSTDGTSASAIAANLSALRALDVAEIGDLIVEHPQASPNCYNLVCPADQKAADEAKSARAGRLANIVHSLAR